METDKKVIEALIEENKSFNVIESEIEMVKKSLDEVLEAIKTVVEKENKFQSIMFIQKSEDSYYLQIKTVLYSKMLKRILSVNLKSLPDQTMIQCFTKDSNSRNPAPGLSRKTGKRNTQRTKPRRTSKRFFKKKQ